MKNSIVCFIAAMVLAGCTQRSENIAFIEHCVKSGKTKIECENKVAKMEYARSVSVSQHDSDGYYYSAPYIVHETVPIYHNGIVIRHETRSVTRYRQQYSPPTYRTLSGSSRSLSYSSGGSTFKTNTYSRPSTRFSRSSSGFGSSSSRRR